VSTARSSLKNQTEAPFDAKRQQHLYACRTSSIQHDAIFGPRRAFVPRVTEIAANIDSAGDQFMMP
jgi:hypothetical protein